MESQNLELGCIKNQWPYPNQDQDAKPQSGTSSILQSKKSGPKGNEGSLHLHNQYKEGKFGKLAYQRLVTKSKWRSKCQTQVRNLKHHPKPQISTWANGCSLHFQNEDRDKNLDHGCIKYQWPYSNQDQDDKPLSGTSSILQSPKSGLKRHGPSLHFQNQDREPKFGPLVWQRPKTISKLRSGSQTLVRNLKHPLKSQTRTERTWMSFTPSKSR